jgi:CheY-like chemotaxis protein
MAQLLVVDDDPTILNVLTEFLSSLGHIVVAAGSGREAIEAMQAHAIDIALVDWQMAGITGRDVVDYARRECPGIKLLVSTGHDSGQVSDSMAGRHAEAVMRKPFSLNELAEIITNLTTESETDPG